MSRPPKQRVGRRPRQGPNADKPRGASRTDDGQLMVLIIGYVLLALLLATVVTAASSVYIEHKKLLSLADGASVAAADSFTLGQLETAGGTPTAVLPAPARAAVHPPVVNFLVPDGIRIEASSTARSRLTR